jgi:hypothetical protein
MNLRCWFIKTLFPHTAAAHGIRDAERHFPSEQDFVEIPLYDVIVAGTEPAPEDERQIVSVDQSKGAVT